MQLPELEPRAKWSVHVVDAASGETLLSHGPTEQCQTASIGKVFLLIEVARRLEAGELSPDAPVEIPEEHRVADSGLFYLMRHQQLSVHDAALLVGAVSDNLATNALIALCGLDAVRAVARDLGYEHTELHDYIRNERLPGMPWTPSFGTAIELADVMRRLAAGDVVSPRVSDQVMAWLAAGADTSMLADAFALDSLAHIDADYQGMLLRHKTGSTSVVRCDIGHVSGPSGEVAYAVLANWVGSEVDLRVPVVDGMRAIGEQIRARVTGRAREDGQL